MRSVLSLGLAVALATMAACARAEEFKSGLQPGDSIGAYTVEKCGGNANDGVADGAKLCYRCKLGNRPVIAVFSRSTNGEVASLMKKLDAVVANNEEKKAASFVNLLGSDEEALKKQAEALVEAAGTENIAVVIPTDNENGPKNLKLNEEAEVTVLIYKNGKIEANHAYKAGQLNDEAIAAIIADTSKILN